MSVELTAAQSDWARYRIVHETRYGYGAPVTIAQHIAHLEPRTSDWQRVASYRLRIDPAPGNLPVGTDPFGNRIARINLAVPHEVFSVTAESEVAVARRPWRLETLSRYRGFQDVAATLRYRGGAPIAATRYRFESPHVRVKQDLAQAIRPLLTEQRSVAESCLAVTEFIHRDFEYVPESTHIGTSILEVLRTRKGVCQDFAHLMIGMLRSNGLAARYVSGYLLTEAAPGAERLVGVDASHAWVAVYCPMADGRSDWIEFDPTNGCLADQRYVTLAWGRDFSDVSPLRGVILGGGEHELSVAVTVTPIDSEAVSGV